MKKQFFVLKKGNKFYDVNDTFKSPAGRNNDTFQFDSEDAALDKAEALGIHLDDIEVKSFSKRD